MNALLSRWVESSASANETVGFLIKLSLLLAGAWLLHAALAWSNPRWRVLLWRGCAVSALVVALLSLAGPTISLGVLPPGIKGSSALPAVASRSITAPAAIPGELLDDEIDPHMPGLPPRPSDAPAADSGGLRTALAELSDRSTPVEGRWTFASYLSVVWGMGVLIGALRELTSVLKLGRLRRRAVAVDASLVAQAVDIAARLRLRKRFEVLATADLASPCVLGAWRPVILLPAAQGASAARDELSAILAHEIAHLKNADLRWNTLLRCLARLFWFHPLLWRARTVHAAACDAVCDATAADFTGDLAGYCRTLARLTLRASAAQPQAGLAMARASSVRRRIEALHRRHYATGLPRWAVLSAVFGGLIGVGLLGTTRLTHAQGGASDAKPAKKATAPAKNYRIAANCYLMELKGEGKDGGQNEPYTITPLPKTHVTLYVARSPLDPAEKVAETIADEKGRFEFTGLMPPRAEMHFDRRAYGVVARAKGHPVAIRPMQDAAERNDVYISPKSASLVGKVVGANGKSIAGATIDRFGIWSCKVPGVGCAVTDQNGRFRIDDLVRSAPEPSPYGETFRIMHPDYPTTEVNVATLPAEAVFSLPTGCTLTGVVQDETTGKRAAGAMVTAESNKDFNDAHAVTDASGRYRLVVAEGNYNLLAETKDRVAVALTDQECPAGQTIELAPIKLTGGGWIVGQVRNSATGEPIAQAKYGPVVVGLFGPAYPPRKNNGVSPLWLAEVDGQARFRLRAAAGNNYPYLVNETGKRMAWDTLAQPPVVVKEGETVEADILVDPVITPAEKMQAGREIVARLPEERQQRLAAILAEMRKLSFDNLEAWCLLLREAVAVGPDAVPQLCAELDQTDDGGMLSWLGFTLRAIGDRRAVPALIRAIPKTLQPLSSDVGFQVADADLMAFMQKHDLDDIGLISVGRAVTEIFGALHKLTGQDLSDEPIFSIMRSDDPNSLALQQQLFRRQAERWRNWWEEHWREFTADKAYAKVKLPADEIGAVRPIVTLGPNSAIGGGISDEVLSPAGENGEQFLDLDTGLEPKWPADIPQNEDAGRLGELALWAAQNGVDLMCVSYRSRDGKSTYALRAFNMRLWEIPRRDAEQIETWLKAAKLPESQPVGELLLHQDQKSGHYLPEENAAFLYITREGGIGVIEVTDRITRVAQTPAYSAPLKGSGRSMGVRFNYTRIIP